MRLSRWGVAAAAAALLVLAVVVVIFVAGGEADEASAPSTSTERSPVTAAPEPPYALLPTRRCLDAAGFDVSSIRSADPRLRALGDLAQRTSLELRRRGLTLGLAFGDTRLLASLLRVPNDPYRLDVDRNALIMSPRGATEAAAAVRRCLRT